MGEYKFRGKEVSGMWHYGNLAILQQKIGNTDAGVYISNRIGLPFAYKVIPKTVGEFTGLNDKNNKEIYKGDIVAKFDFEVQDLQSVVIRHLGAFGYIASGNFIAFASNCHFNWNNNQSDKILVIGNIHDNPEIIPKKYECLEEKKMKNIPEEGTRVHVYSADKKKDRGMGTIEKVEPLRIEEAGLTIASTYPSRIVLDSGEVTEGLDCWWISVEREKEILKVKRGKK